MNDEKLFTFSPKEEKMLSEIHPDLAKTVRYARVLQEFIVGEGKRTLARQRKLVAAGASQTLNSRHLTGHAVDLFATIDGKVRWDWPLYYRIAEAMAEAARKYQIKIIWGGVWDQPLDSITDAETAVADYVMRRKNRGRRAFIDGPHFELALPDGV